MQINKYYTLSMSEDYEDALWLIFDNNQFDYKILLAGQPIDKLPQTPQLKTSRKVSQKSLMQYDYLTSGGLILVSRKFENLLTKYAKDYLQFFDAQILNGNQLVSEFKILNITHMIQCVDVSRSSYEPLISYLPDGPKDFHKFYFDAKALNKATICRVLESPTTIVLGEKLVNGCLAAEIKGCDFLIEGTELTQRDAPGTEE